MTLSVSPVRKQMICKPAGMDSPGWTHREDINKLNHHFPPAAGGDELTDRAAEWS